MFSFRPCPCFLQVAANLCQFIANQSFLESTHLKNDFIQISFLMLPRLCCLELVKLWFLFDPSDRPGLQQRGVIDELQENLALTLQTWIDCKRTAPDKQ